MEENNIPPFNEPPKKEDQVDPETPPVKEEEKKSPELVPENLDTGKPSEFGSVTVNPRKVELDQIFNAVSKVRQEVHKVIVGQDKLIDLLLVSLFAGGHVLIEGVPGIAKTLTANLLAETMSTNFSRIQFTPDLMPTDVLGTSVFNMKTSEFNFKPGPIFSNIVLIDEINRAPAKTQAALFEVMQEKQITIDGNTRQMEYPFFVIATQNPVEQEGTYKLPEAQLDRFLFRIKIDYPSLDEERQILGRFKEDFDMDSTEKVSKVFSPNEIKKCQEIIEKIHIQDKLLDYIANIVYATRHHGDLFLGASPRASLAILKAAKSIAAMAGRDFVTPDDIQYVAYPALNHRIILTPEREIEGLESEDIIKDIIQKIEVPR